MIGFETTNTTGLSEVRIFCVGSTAFLGRFDSFCRGVRVIGILQRPHVRALVGPGARVRALRVT